MDYEEKLINHYTQLKHREEVKSGYHNRIKKCTNTLFTKQGEGLLLLEVVSIA